MGALFRYLRQRLVFKIGMVTLVVIAAGFAASSYLNSRRAASALQSSTIDASTNLAQGMIAGIRGAMLAGNGILVQDLITEAQSKLPSVSIRVFDQAGAQVFTSAGPAPTPGSLSPELSQVLGGTPRAHSGATVLRGLPNQERCQACHPALPAVRGVVALVPTQADSPSRRAELLGTIVTDAFKHIMTARKLKQSELDDYFRELGAAAPGLHVAVFDHEASVAYGERPPGDEDTWRAAVLAAAAPGAEPRDLDIPGQGPVRLVPLPMEPRCQECHKDSRPVRGVLAVALPLAPVGAPGAELEAVLEVSLQNIMLVALGRLVTRFLDSVARSGAVNALILYDGEGRLYYDAFARPTPPPAVAAALAGRKSTLRREGGDLVVVEPLLNDMQCQRCHGGDLPVRGAVEIRASTARAEKAERDAMRSAAGFAGLTVVLCFLVLWLVLKRIVVDPVRRIGDVAEKIGGGDLTGEVTGATAGGDEVARLGARINEMVQGLRAKLHLEKFVSRGAAAAAEAASTAAQGGAAFRSIRSSGERRACAVLFTDIRGFTSYAEKIPPEDVVKMLNRILAAQAEVVHRCGGDIDKFVGDELMAVFLGDDGARHAVQAGLEMVEAVRAARAGTDIAVGGGVSYGEVVYGAIGAEDRMDYTVIGDVVNTGARLCSAASAGELLCTEAVVASCGDNPGGIAFDPIEPLKVKGKKEPLRTYLARRG